MKDPVIMMNEEHLEPSSASTDLTLGIYSLHCLHKYTYSQIVYTVAQKLLGNEINQNHVFQRSYSFELLVLDIIKRNVQHPCDLENINENFMGGVLCVDRYMSYIIQVYCGITRGRMLSGKLFTHIFLCRYMSYRCTHPHKILCN